MGKMILNYGKRSCPRWWWQRWLIVIPVGIVALIFLFYLGIAICMATGHYP
jgi:hypothetical protein